MDLFSSAWDVISSFFLLVFGFAVSLKLAKRIGTSANRVAALYFWHTFFCIFYIYYAIYNGGDAFVYYEESLFSEIDFSVGTRAILFLTRIFSYYFELSFFGVFLIYNLVGAVGLIAFDASLRYASYEKTKSVRILASFLVFLPSISFWSSAIGKDAISFAAVGLALWAAIDFNRRIWLMIFSVFIMLLVRPHMAGLMVFSLAISLIFREKISFAKKSFLIIVSFVSAAVIIPFALEYSGLNGVVGVDKFEEYIEQRQDYNQDGGGGIDISSMSLPMQIFTYLFRPLPFEAHSIFALAASFDNIILIIIFILGFLDFIKYRKYRQIEKRTNILFLWIYSFSAWWILAITTANLGISVRQKWMFAPILIFLFISMMKKRKIVLIEN